MSASPVRQRDGSVKKLLAAYDLERLLVLNKEPTAAGTCIPALSLNVMLATSPQPAISASFQGSHARNTQILVLMVVVTNVLGNVSLSHGMRQVGRTISASPLDYLRALENPWTIVGICILIVWMLSDLALLSRADLSFVLPVTASAYVLVALAGHFLLGEHVSWGRWTGILLITLGVILAEETPERTTNGAPESRR